jgi:hypothetical protein
VSDQHPNVGRCRRPPLGRQRPAHISRGHDGLHGQPPGRRTEDDAVHVSPYRRGIHRLGPGLGHRYPWRQRAHLEKRRYRGLPHFHRLLAENPRWHRCAIERFDGRRRGRHRAALVGRTLSPLDAQITFDTDAQGQATALVLHQNGRDRRAKRIDDATAKQLEDTVSQRFKEQKANPASEGVIRRQIDEFQRRQPNFDQLTPEFAALARPQAAHIEDLIAGLGLLQSVVFKGAGTAAEPISTK